jgi:CheY-like chemotaxis protein
VSPPESYRIVSVDDDFVVARLVVATLAAGGYTVESNTSAEEALHATAAWPTVDLLVTDYAMPVMDGLTLVEQARSRGFRGKVILFAGAIAAPVQLHAVLLRIEKVIEKPGSSGELLASVQALLVDPARGAAKVA